MAPRKASCILAAAVAFLYQSPAQDSGTRNATRARTHPDSGEVKNGVYHNPFFGFSYKIPFGWVDRSKEMRQADDPARSLLLLSIFERPPEATGSTINSAVVIAAENLSSFSGVKTSTDYFASITELAEAKGFKIVNEPHSNSIGTKQLIRGDFSKPRGTMMMYQSSLVALEKGYALSFTFIGGREDEVQELTSRLSLGGDKSERF
jgi:hypothetical protein